jgi:hypothetical protein
MTTETTTQVPQRVIDLLAQAHLLLQDAQAHADRWDRAGLGRTLDIARWQVADLLDTIEPYQYKGTEQ